LNMQEHRRDQETRATFALIVTSDTRTPETDETGKRAIQLLEKVGHDVKAHVIVRNDTTQIKKAFEGFVGDEEVQVIVTSGGTGIGAKDRTVDAISEFFDRGLEGFGELFRRMSYEEIGVMAMISRATAGIAGGKIVFCLPGSKGAVETALKEIILPALGHMLWELKRQ
jgi:molybdenum cofactor biosynthesis protein B